MRDVLMPSRLFDLGINFMAPRLEGLFPNCGVLECFIPVMLLSGIGALVDYGLPSNIRILGLAVAPSARLVAALSFLDFTYQSLMPNE